MHDLQELSEIVLGILFSDTYVMFRRLICRIIVSVGVVLEILWPLVKKPLVHDNRIKNVLLPLYSDSVNMAKITQTSCDRRVARADKH